PPPSVPREEPPTGPATPRQITTRPPHLAREPVEMAVPAAPQPWVTIDIPHSLGKGDVARVLARAVRARYSGAIAFEDTTGIRRVVFRDGDFVTAAAGIDGESLVAFLGQRGDLQPDAVQRLGRKLPQFGRHAGAALIAQGHLRQDDLWPVLRGHAEWLLTRLVLLESGAASLEHDVPPRLSAEPSVFGGATGAEVFIEVLRRAVPPDRAIAWLGGPGARFAAGDLGPLLAETALPDDDLRIVMSASGATLDELLERAPGPDIAAVLFGLVELGVLKLRTSAAPARPVQRAVDPLDHDALRARVRARRALVDEGDYFALLGVERSATGYDIRRAYTDLRRELDPSRVLTPATADLSEDVELILEVLDEAYEVLRDQVRRERYRRALEQEP
ncbi:MAG TPA: DnaJ domain-containing protein, partial [Polyangiaceae bacterium]|nr:DnaJ domain-containing protein [Polyangiaceae bacterium]